MTMANVTEHCMKIQIPEISKLNVVWSPEISIHGIPWKVKVCKTVSYEGPSMSVYLYCASKDETLNWSLWGSLSIKLFSFNDKVRPLEFHSSAFIFDRLGGGYGKSSFIQWDDLFDKAKSYVQNDTIKLEVNVKAEDPNDPNRSRLNFKCIDKCCENAMMATYHLTVTNIANFAAVRSPQFKLRGLMWEIQVSKGSDSHLGVLLLLKDDSKTVSCQMTMLIKLVSGKKDVQPIEKNDSRKHQIKKNIYCVHVVSWDEMFKPENGFVNNNSITLEIELTADKPEIDDTFYVPNAKRAKLNEGKSVQMECAVCLESIDNQLLACTPCGHMFCFECIKKEVTVRGKCPTCTTPVQLNALRELYLPTIN